jgi:hypothetical protein
VATIIKEVEPEFLFRLFFALCNTFEGSASGNTSAIEMRLKNSDQRIQISEANVPRLMISMTIYHRLRTSKIVDPCSEFKKLVEKMIGSFLQLR